MSCHNGEGGEGHEGSEPELHQARGLDGSSPASRQNGAEEQLCAVAENAQQLPLIGEPRQGEDGEDDKTVELDLQPEAWACDRPKGREQLDVPAADGSTRRRLGRSTNTSLIINQLRQRNQPEFQPTLQATSYRI